MYAIIKTGGKQYKVQEGASVEGRVVKTGKKKKILVFKYNSKKNYRRRQGHRQPYTKVQIEKIKA